MTTTAAAVTTTQQADAATLMAVAEEVAAAASANQTGAVVNELLLVPDKHATAHHDKILAQYDRRIHESEYMCCLWHAHDAYAQGHSIVVRET